MKFIKHRCQLLFTPSAILVLLIILFFAACRPVSVTMPQSVSSPGQNIHLDFFFMPDSQPAYLVRFNETMVIDTSSLGFEFRDAAAMAKGFVIVKVEDNTFNESWEMPWGEQRNVVDHYNQLRVQLRESQPPNRILNVVFRVYDDGLGFRYEFPEQDGFTDIAIMDENTQFNLTGDHTCWWIPGDWDIYEHLYNTTRVSEIDAISKRNHPNLAQTYIPENAVNTPVTMKTDAGIYLSFHEAALTDYAGMTLKVDTENLLLQSELVGSRDGSKVKRRLPFVTPWRTIQIAKRFVDFASENGIGAVLIEGWNTGWERWIGFEDREGVFDFVTPYPDYDLEAVVQHGKEKGVDIIMHHETSAAPRTYEQQMDSAFALCNRLGIHAVKTGYVGKIIPKGEYHHGQWMVNHYRKVLKKAAEYEMMVNTHEPIKATGIRRTYPNMISREGLRGQEFNAWSVEMNPPEHLTIVPFTRMLAGPIDFTPGIFDIKFDEYKDKNQVNTTLAQQLAIYVVIYSPIQMAADLLENDENQPAFQFIRDVGVDWQESKVLNGEIGEYVTIARKEREIGKWFLGSLTDENAREIEIQLDFLDRDKNYFATIYADAADAHWDKNPTAIEIRKRTVTSEDHLELRLAAGGGAAVSFIPEKKEY